VPLKTDDSDKRKILPQPQDGRGDEVGGGWPHSDNRFLFGPRTTISRAAKRIGDQSEQSTPNPFPQRS
jgi:hypothetical protein